MAGHLTLWASSIASICLCGFGASPSGTAPKQPPRAQDQVQPAEQAGASWTIVQRIDRRHIVALFGGGELYLPQAAFEAGAVGTPEARFGRVIDVPDSLLEKVIGNRAHITDTWIVDAGRRGRFHFRVERLVLGHKDCGEGWGVVAGVAADEAAVFDAVPEQYFAGRRERLAAPPKPITKVGAISLTLSDVDRAALTTLVETERQRAWPALHRQAEDIYARMRDGAEAQTWRALDARFDRGEAVLDYNFQAFRMTPDGDPRLFVRATWRIAGTVVYAMSAWVHLSGGFSIDDVDASVTLHLRYGSEGVGNPWRDEFLGVVLNVLDTDGDGRGEVLLTVAGYESQGMELFVYPIAPGRPHVTIATYSDGC
jgi:hypothetical protein